MNPTPPPSGCANVVCDEDGFVLEGSCETCVCECFSGEAKEICCPDGLFWNPANNVCDWDFNNPGCSDP